jgi:hypothetical protein
MKHEGDKLKLTKKERRKAAGHLDKQIKAERALHIGDAIIAEGNELQLEAIMHLERPADPLDRTGENLAVMAGDMKDIGSKVMKAYVDHPRMDADAMPPHPELDQEITRLGE